MKSSTSFLLQLLLGAACILSTSALKCGADNCLRAFFPTGDSNDARSRRMSAGAFCHFLSTTAPTPTSYVAPRQATAACGNAGPAVLSRYSSACQCRPSPSCTTTARLPPPTNAPLIQNGGFECSPSDIRDGNQLFPFEFSRAVPGNTQFRKVPYDTNSFNYVAEIANLGDPTVRSLTESLLFQPVPGLVTFKVYRLQYLVWFASTDFFGNGEVTPAGRVEVQVNHWQVDYVDSAKVNAGNGAWISRSVTFSAQALYDPFDTKGISFWIYSDYGGTRVRIDEVSLTALS
ncbi:MAG: hypothetical protein M1837_003664 [Sclerophora amabilis]|nr:MAG: hypothetical protein M1837_003664 [Sclerophora amabilis]